ncbi:MAG: hypothetical protein KDB61_05420, partial [Planctomycetes bacterium]|nr:hypothetical protein [Planctomycetota bacterium]
ICPLPRSSQVPHLQRAMTFWTYFWGITLALVMLIYLGLVLWVTIGGMSDIRSMLNALMHSEGKDQDLHG